MHVRIEGPGKIPWSFKDVDGLSAAMINCLPSKALSIIMNENFGGTKDFVRLEHAIARPSYRELRANFVLLKPVVQKFPAKAQHDLHLNNVASVHVSKLLNSKFAAGPFGIVPHGRPAADP
eukprot:s7088_g1.t1